MAEIKAEKMATRQAYGKTLVELGKTTRIWSSWMQTSPNPR